MASIFLTQIWIYPIKSMRGIPLSSVKLTDRGPEHDRRWMVVDEDGTFQSQREIPKLVQFHPEIEEEGIYLRGPDKSKILIPFQVPDSEDKIRVKVWDSECWALPVDPMVDNWLSERLDKKVRLVYMPDFSQRRVDERYADGDLVSFADGFPYLLLSNESLTDLNSRLVPPVPVQRFRPNFVVFGKAAFDEDTWDEFKIGNAVFVNAKPCARCVVVNLDSGSGEQKSREPLKTLSTYRKVGNKVLFGINLLLKKGEEVQVGDLIKVKSRKT